MIEVSSNMGRILALDYGTKRTGIAVTDPLRIVATGLDTVTTQELMPYLQNYLAKEKVGSIVIGIPYNLKGDSTDATPHILGFIKRLKVSFPEVTIYGVEERFSSKDATRAIRDAGAKKTQRRDKALVDRVAAVILLQEFMARPLLPKPL